MTGAPCRGRPVSKPTAVFEAGREPRPRRDRQKKIIRRGCNAKLAGEGRDRHCVEQAECFSFPAALTEPSDAPTGTHMAKHGRVDESEVNAAISAIRDRKRIDISQVELSQRW